MKTDAHARRCSTSGWMPFEAYGWFWCSVEVDSSSYKGRIRLSLLLWWNEDSIDGGWWVGGAGKTVSLRWLLPTAVVVGISHEGIPVKR